MGRPRNSETPRTKIEQICLDRGLSVQDFADRAGLELSEAYRFMAGERSPTLAKAMRVARALNRAVTTLFDDEGRPQKP